MFADFAEAVPVAIELDAPREKAPLVLGDLKSVANDCTYKVIDAMAALDDGGDLLISVVHRGTPRTVQLNITLNGFKPQSRAQISTLSAEVPWKANTLDDPEAVKPIASTAMLRGNSLSLTLNPYSFTRVRIP
jgi:alpha-L-arabinofuranosidase